MDEQFRPIEDYPGYRISRLGEVQSCKARQGRKFVMSESWRAIKPIDRLGYFTVNLSVAGRKTPEPIHRLALEAFVGPCPEGLICCHNDGNPKNNRLENLRWDTHRANSEDARRHGTLRQGEAINTAKLREADVLEIRRLRSAGTKIGELAARFHVGRYTIRDIVRGHTWKHLLPHDEAHRLYSEAVEHRRTAA